MSWRAASVSGGADGRPPCVCSAWTLPNVITVSRSVLAITLLLLAASLHSLPLCITGWAVYWVGDVLDGLVARMLYLETRLGAVLDSTADRVCMLALLIAVDVCAHLEPIGPMFFGALFCLVDWPLSLMFLRLRLLGPNYFSLASRPLYWLNWHPVAKTLSGGAFPLLMLCREPALLVGFDVCYASVKAFSLLYAARLPAAPNPMDADGFGCRPAHRRMRCDPATGQLPDIECALPGRLGRTTVTRRTRLR
jgi:phosphatidylglycerophosphate synthase